MKPIKRLLFRSIGLKTLKTDTMKTNSYIMRQIRLLLLILVSGLSTITVYAQSALCESVGQDQNFEWVTRLKIGVGSGTTGKTGYYDFSGTSFATVAPSEVLPVEVDVRTDGSTYQEYVKIWLDLNQDNSIDNATELVYNSNANVTTFMTFTGNITMPVNSFNGTMFGRMIMQYAASPNLCGNYTYGTTYDFRLTVSGGVVNPTNKILTVAVTGSGYVISDPAGINTSTGNFSANFLENSSVSLTATASGGNTFSGWSGAATGTSPSVNINMGTSDKNVTATFEAPATVPVLSTTDVSSVTATDASSGGNITNGGSSAVTARGVCWSTSANPVITGNKTTDGSGTGSFTSTISGLSSGTVYYVRAFATNTAGTAYGNQVTFATQPTDPTAVTASASTIYIGSSTDLTASGVQGTIYWYSGSCGGTSVGAGNPLTVSPTTTTTYFARNNSNSVFSNGCASLTITVNKYDQTITFDPIPEKIYGITDLTPASASSGLSVTYTSSNTSVSTIVDNKLHIVGVGSSEITAAQAGNSTYNPATDVMRTLTITKAPLTATADNKNKNYGAPNPVLTITYTGFVYSESESVLDTKPIASTPITVNSNTGTYPIELTTGTDNNYDITTNNGILSVDKTTIIVTADNQTKDYGEAAPALTFQYSGWMNGDDSEDLTTKPSASSTVTELSPVAVYSGDITLAGGTDENYSFSYVPADMAVTKATITATADAKSKVYGEANPALTFQYSGWVNGDDSDDLTTKPSASATVNELSSVGVYSDDITMTGGADENYSFLYIPANLTVTKATLTASADAKTKVYGEANPALTFQYSGWVNGDDSEDLTTNPSASASVTELSPVGVYPGDITVSGGADENYNFTYTAADMSVTIATLSITADAKSKVYGEANPSLTFQYSGWVNGDDPEDLATNPTASATVTELSPVGVYSGDITVAGGADENYNFTYTSADMSVTKANLSITADAESKVYGEANPSLTFQYSGWVNGDNSEDLTTEPSAYSSVSELSPAGVYPGDISLSGGADENYNFNYTAADMSVTKANLSVTAVSKTKVYGEANPALTFQYSGWVNGDDSEDLAIKPTASTTITELSPAGVYTADINVAGGTDENYNFIYTAANMSVTKANLAVTADTKTKVYGETNPALTFQYSGWVNGDDSEDLATKPAAYATVTELSPVAVYTGDITITGGVDENYSFSYVPADMSVTKANLTVTADNLTRIFGTSNPELTFTYTGFVNNDDVSSIDTNPVILTPADVLSDAGFHPIVLAGGFDNNYNLNRVDGSLNITKALLTATADNKIKTFSELNPELTITYDGFKNSDNSSSLDLAPVASTIATLTSDAGSYPITLQVGSDNNYDISIVAGTLTIDKAILTVTSENKTRLYSEENPAFTVIYSGFVNGDNEDVLDVKPFASTPALLTDNAGVYTITAAGGVDNNYNFTYSNGSLTINKSMLTIIAEDKTRKYGESNPNLTYSYTGFKNNDNETVLDILPVISTTANEHTAVGTVPLTLTIGNDNNYDFTLTDGTMSITKATLVISSDNKTKIYGSTNPALTISWSGFVNREDNTVLTQAPLLQVNADNRSNTGIYPINVTGAESENYSIEYITGHLTVNKAPLNVTAVNNTKKYLEQVPALLITIDGFVNSDSQSAVDVLPSASTTANSNTDAGTYDITVAGGSDNNYSFVYNRGILSILKADQVISFEQIPDGLRTTLEHQLIGSATSNLPVEFYSSESSIVSISGSDLKVEREGSVHITARQIGDNNWNPAQDVVQTIVTLPTFDGIRSLFTPNNDGMNDTWYIPDIEQYGKFSVQIYNRFGKLLYESSAYKNDWNGTYNGTPLPSASYYYLIKSDVTGIVKGVVNIVR